MSKRKIFVTAFKDTIPIMTGFIVLGIGFGIVLKDAGYGILWSFLMSFFIYAGSLQFVGVNLITGGTSFLTVALTTLMVNARHLFYGISMADEYKNTGLKKPYLIFGLTDETYSLVCNKKEGLSVEDRKAYYFLVTLFDHFYWTLGSVLGSLLGELIVSSDSFISTKGVDFALTALFITVFTDQWLKAKNHLPSLIGLIASVLSLIVFKKNNFLIPAMILISVLLLTMRRFIDKEERKGE